MEEVDVMSFASSAMTARAVLAPVIGAAIVCVPSVARAHFTLDYPPEWTVDSDSSGDPQKAFPCGVLSTDTFTMSGMMTTFAPGQMITVKWTEVVPHDGWFRIALSYMNGAEFQSTTDFTEPSYATDNTAPPLGPFSLDASIESPPVPPVLIDDIDPHTAASVSAPMQYSQNITLPNATCDKCVLQVIQIMLNHPVNQPNNVPGAAYTYHHCAFISIAPNGDGGTQIVDASALLDAGGDSNGGGRMDATTGSMGSGGSGTGTGTGSGAGSSGTSGAGTTPSGSSGAGTSNGGTASSGSGMSNGSGASIVDASGTGTTAAAGESTKSGSGGCTVSPNNRPNATALSSLLALGFMAGARRGRRRV
jgi:uncharacterized membrane protein YgcG